MANGFEEGRAAPDLRLPAAEGGEVSLAALRGQWVVLFFYPKASTAG